MDERSYFGELTKVLSERHRRPISIAADTELLGDGLVDSASMLEIILLTEELSGRTLEIDEIDTAMFESARSLYEAFFSGGRAASQEDA